MSLKKNWRMEIEHVSETTGQTELGVYSSLVERESLYSHANIAKALEESVNVCCVFRQMEMNGGENRSKGARLVLSPPV